MQHIYVNLSATSVRVSLPSGAPFEVPPSHAIEGEIFERYARASLLIPIEGCPPRFVPKKLHSPLDTDRTRAKNSQSVSDKETPPAHVLAGGGVDKTFQDAIQAKIDGASSVIIQEAGVVIKNNTSNETPSPAMFEGDSLVAWKARIVTSDPAAFASSLKLPQLKELAHLFGVKTEGLETKLQLAIALAEVAPNYTVTK